MSEVSASAPTADSERTQRSKVTGLFLFPTVGYPVLCSPGPQRVQSCPPRHCVPDTAETTREEALGASPPGGWRSDLLPETETEMETKTGTQSQYTQTHTLVVPWQGLHVGTV